ncbi:MAG: hypothetical protein DRN81_02195 [Thermoproteota archaeon]|nr:MAG: hypothetical protein DRN81_02195 [Candidatus Korarchaeota archaeon]
MEDFLTVMKDTKPSIGEDSLDQYEELKRVCGR